MRLFTDTPTGMTVIDRPTGLATLANSFGTISSQRRANQEVAHEQCRAMLAYTAMENTTMLSAMEAFCYRTAPFGEDRYRRIVDAYAAGAVNRILRW